MSANDNLIEDICGSMFPGAYYPLKVIKEQYTLTFGDNGKMAKKIPKILLAESKKKNGKVRRIPLSSTGVVYSLNEDYNFDDERKLIEATSVTRMAKVISEMSQKQTTENLDKWLSEDLYNVLDKLVTEKISKEFKEEVLPVLRKSIDETVAKKIKMSKGMFKIMLLDIIGDVINSIEDGS